MPLNSGQSKSKEKMFSCQQYIVCEHKKRSNALVSTVGSWLVIISVTKMQRISWVIFWLLGCISTWYTILRTSPIIFFQTHPKCDEWGGGGLNINFVLRAFINFFKSSSSVLMISIAGCLLLQWNWNLCLIRLGLGLGLYLYF